MNFEQLLNDYINTLEITAKELSEYSGLNQSVISRYRTGERQPAQGSEQLDKLITGLSILAEKCGHPEISREKLQAAFDDALNQKLMIYDRFFKHFTCLLDALNINMKNLASGINYDITFLYRIRSGARKPQNISEFSEALCRYIAKNFSDERSLDTLCSLLDCPKAEITDSHALYHKLLKWLISSEEKTSNQMEHFLHTLNDFDLNEYIEAIHFNELKVPTAPFQLPVTRNYFGLKEMRQGELDFFKTTVLSKSKKPVFMCSDMPMEDMSKDMDFNKKWMFGIAASLKKGLHLNIIHNIDRSFRELMLGFEAWIPIYMTGQVSPYHLPEHTTSFYQHLTYVSGACALSGECITGQHSHGKYYLTNKKEEVTYYKTRSEDLLKKAKPLMNIYRQDTEKEFHLFLEQNMHVECDLHNILSVPPLYTLTKDLLETILDTNTVSEETKQRVRKNHELQTVFLEQLLSTNVVVDELSVINRESFQNYPVTLSLAGDFSAEKITYTYEQYQEHIRLTENFAAQSDHYTLKTIPVAFRNIQISIFKNKFAVISKKNTPVIQFVIHHPKMVNLLDNFVVIAQDED